VPGRFRPTEAARPSPTDRREARGSTRSIGRAAERRVRLHFLLRGYRVLAANTWAGGNELDLVVRRGRRLVVCEVKTRSSDGFGSPVEMVTAEKTRRVRRAAEAWLAAHPELADLEVTLEAVAVRDRRVERVPIG
jgi:putative endonuclease